jgi:hypothetical protein
VDLTYISLNDQLNQRFPMLAEKKYTELIGHIDAGPYVVYGVIFNRYLLDLVSRSDAKAKEDAASFLEEMATSSDDRVTDLLKSEILPTLLGHQSTIDAFWSFLGPVTRRLLSLLPPKFYAGIELPRSS